MITVEEAKKRMLLVPGKDLEFMKRIVLLFMDDPELPSRSHYNVTSENGKRIMFHAWFPTERYFFDFNMDLNKWLQIDTSEDAPYYGNWICPEIMARISYVEGDITVQVSEDMGDFLQNVKEYEIWSLENQGRWSMDEGLNPCDATKDFLKLYADFSLPTDSIVSEK